MPRTSGPMFVSGSDLWSSSATPKARIGAQAYDATGSRLYRYVLNGASALVVGNALQSRVQDTDHDDVTVRVTAIEANQLLITTGSGGGALDENEYAGGYVVVDTAPGEGYIYRIDSHAAIAASTNGALILDKADPIQVALTASSKATLVASPYNKVIQHPVTTASGVCVGGAIFPIPANEYGWIQTYGPGAALIAGTPAVGQPVTSVGAVAGALSVHSAELNVVAEMMVTGRNTIICPVFWLRP